MGSIFSFLACHVDPQAASVELTEAEDDDDDDDDHYDNYDYNDSGVILTMMTTHMMIPTKIMMMFPLVLVMEGRMAPECCP